MRLLGDLCQVTATETSMKQGLLWKGVVNCNLAGRLQSPTTGGVGERD